MSSIADSDFFNLSSFISKTCYEQELDTKILSIKKKNLFGFSLNDKFLELFFLCFRVQQCINTLIECSRHKISTLPCKCQLLYSDILLHISGYRAKNMNDRIRYLISKLLNQFRVATCIRFLAAQLSA